METVEEGKKGVYLFIACYSSESKKSEAFIAVTKAMLYDEVIIDMENLGDHAILFTSTLSISEIKNKLRNTKAHYLLIDISMSYDLESIYGFLPDSKIKMIKDISESKFSKNKIHLKKKLEDSVDNESYELAASLKDFLDDKNK